MRIVYFAKPYRNNDTSGGNAHIGQFISHATRLGHEIWTSMPDDRQDTQCLPQNRLRRLLSLRQMDVMYMRVEWEPRTQCRLSINPYRRIIGNPVVAWEFNTVPEYGKVIGNSDEGVLRSIETFRHYGKGCDIAFCVSNAIEEYVRDRLGIKKTCVIPNGSDPEIFHPDVPLVSEIKRLDDGLNVVWIGSANIPWHDINTIISAANLLWKEQRGEKITFHLIGQDTEKLVNIPPNINCHGPKQYSELPSWMAGMDVGLCLYKPGPAYYGSPSKIFDYMACSLAVVGNEQPQSRELLAEMGQTDSLIPYSDPQALAEVLLNLLENRDRVKHQGEEGRRLVMEKYNWKRAVKNTISQLESFISQSLPL